MGSLAIGDWLMVGAVVLAPLIAVQVSQWLERSREIRQRRVDVFRTLMTTRRARMAPDHIRALNMIDIEFSGGDRKSREVVDAWKAYLDHLNNATLSTEAWGTRGDDLFVDLIYSMANAVGYDFDKTHLRRAAYYPRGYGEAEWDQQAIRVAFREVMEGKRWIPVWVGGTSEGQPPQAGLGTPQEMAQSVSDERPEQPRLPPSTPEDPHGASGGSGA